ncbi:unnamed protein product [Vitrella brassicaformis CCMP3155]|uniref:U-box domain-containing protein n=1 Tax=Vitrella brassicaformis (strain CCMP3155) TaxID=1169540 RepID=A0A0G4EJV4_VITBC|nr:unnamed protein product [Vitrella brassicaformis CCMP3155]|eukprot:CEL96795.1 unnamed protein product [Vitrella brassicaformis CCMP3155]
MFSGLHSNVFGQARPSPQPRALLEDALLFARAARNPAAPVLRPIPEDLPAPPRSPARPAAPRRARNSPVPVRFPSVDANLIAVLDRVPDEEFADDVPRCPLTLTVPRTPVTTPSGNCYDLSPLRKHIRTNAPYAKSPMTRQLLREEDLRPDRSALHHIERCAKKIWDDQQAAIQQASESASAAAAAAASSNAHDDNETDQTSNSMTLVKELWGRYKHKITMTHNDLTPTPKLIDAFLTDKHTDTMDVLEWHKEQIKKQSKKHLKEIHDVVSHSFEKEMVAWLNSYSRTTQQAGYTKRRSLTGFHPTLIRDAVSAILKEALK